MNTQERLDYINNKASIEDYLQEDPPVYNQNFFVMSYLLPSSNNELEFPVIKMRGAFKTIEECQNRINKLKNIDSYFDMYVCEVGKFGSLLSSEEIKKNEQIDVEYREAQLNNMVKSYKENKDKVDQEFEARKKRLSDLAKYQGTKEGQQELSKQKENPIAVKTRVETLSAHLEDLKKKIDEVTEIVELSKKQLENDYTEEELKAAEEEILTNNIDNLKIESEPIASMFSKDDPFLSRKGKEVL
jgi:hypothetical protein